jgi:hypothetical protein
MAVLLFRIGRAHRGLHGDERRRADRTGTAKRSAAAGAKRRMAQARLFCLAMQSAPSSYI